MNQTTNYNFNVPVGSDVVNPLVQDFPNWTSLDTILKNVANTGIATATHSKAGTVHTITLSDADVPVFRFQATGDFNYNDSVVVDGIPVSALTVSGEALPTGSFVIGSMVLCELRDTLLTVYTAGTDANTLEGHGASYFATATDLQTVDDKADANKTLIDNITDGLTWKKVGSASGSGSLTIPASFRELLVVVKAAPASPVGIYTTEHLISNNELSEFSTTYETWLFGGGAISNTSNFRTITSINSAHTTLHTTDVTINGADYLQYATTVLYYR